MCFTKGQERIIFEKEREKKVLVAKEDQRSCLEKDKRLCLRKKIKRYVQ